MSANASDVEPGEEGDESTLARHAQRLQVRRSGPFNTARQSIIAMFTLSWPITTYPSPSNPPEPAVRIGELDLEGFR